MKQNAKIKKPSTKKKTRNQLRMKRYYANVFTKKNNKGVSRAAIAIKAYNDFKNYTRMAAANENIEFTDLEFKKYGYNDAIENMLVAQDYDTKLKKNILVGSELLSNSKKMSAFLEKYPTATVDKIQAKLDERTKELKKRSEKLGKFVADYAKDVSKESKSFLNYEQDPMSPEEVIKEISPMLSREAIDVAFAKLADREASITFANETIFKEDVDYQVSSDVWQKGAKVQRVETYGGQKVAIKNINGKEYAFLKGRATTKKQLDDKRDNLIDVGWVEYKRREKLWLDI